MSVLKEIGRKYTSTFFVTETKGETHQVKQASFSSIIFQEKCFDLRLFKYYKNV